MTVYHIASDSFFISCIVQCLKYISETRSAFIIRWMVGKHIRILTC